MTPELRGHIRYLLEAELKRRKDDLARLLVEIRAGIETDEMLPDYENDVVFSERALKEFAGERG